MIPPAYYSCIMCHWSIGQCGLHITWLQWSNSGPSPAAVLSTTWPIRSWHPLESWTSTVNIRVMWSSGSFPPKSNVKVWANLGLTVFFFTRVFFFATRRLAENSSTLTYGSGNWNNSNTESLKTVWCLFTFTLNSLSVDISLNWTWELAPSLYCKKRELWQS